MLKRVVIGVLVVLMTLSLPGCQPSAVSPTAPSQVAQASAEKSTAVPSDASETSGDVEQAGLHPGIDPIRDGGLYGSKDYSKEEMIQLTYAGVGMSDEVQVFSQSDPIISMIENKFNFRYAEAVGLTWGNWDETMRIWINAGDIPDVMFYNINYLDLLNYTDQGLLKDIGVEDFAQKYPMLNEVIETTQISREFVERFGGLYILPRVVYRDPPTDPLVGHQMLVMRKDWMQQLGFDIKDRYTTSEIIQIGSKMASEAATLPGAFPGQTFGIDTTHMAYLSQLFMDPYNIHYSTFPYDEAAGEYVWGAADPSTVKGLEVWQKAWKEGALHKEFYIDANRSPGNNLAAGLCGITFDCGTGMCAFSTRTTFASIEGNDANNLHYAAYIADDGKAHLGETTNYWGGTVFSPSIEEPKMQRYLQMLDWLSTDPGQHLLRLGVYGTDWVYDDDGQMSILREQNADGSYPSINSIYKSLGKKNATQDEVREAAKDAMVDDFVGDLPYGYDTNCGEQGSWLSGGQKQRVCIARALVRKAPVLVLDEITSALDAESESQVLQTIQRQRGKQTILFTTHNLQQTVAADRIIVMKEGAIVEQGTYSELIDQQGEYARLWSDAVRQRGDHGEA